MGGSGSGKTTLLNAIAGRGQNMEVRKQENKINKNKKEETKERIDE